MASASDATDELLEWARKGLEQIYRQGFKYKKTGVLLNHLVPAGQLSVRHWVCFHLNFEHEGDPDEPCQDPDCFWKTDLYRNKS